MKWEMFEASGFKQDKTTVQQLGNLQPEFDSLQTNRLGGITTVALPLILRSFNIANSALTQRVELSDFFFEKQRKKNGWLVQRKEEGKKEKVKENQPEHPQHPWHQTEIHHSSSSFIVAVIGVIIPLIIPRTHLNGKLMQDQPNSTQVLGISTSIFNESSSSRVSFFFNISFLLSSSSLAIHFHFSVNLINGRFWPAVVRTDRIWSEKFRCWRDGRPCRAFMEEARHGR